VHVRLNFGPFSRARELRVFHTPHKVKHTEFHRSSPSARRGEIVTSADLDRVKNWLGLWGPTTKVRLPPACAIINGLQKSIDGAAQSSLWQCSGHGSVNIAEKRAHHALHRHVQTPLLTVHDRPSHLGQ